ncbi:hypothetical protein B0H17DRAFT_1150455 [Mycena rosella]|uniref:Uncharacterized protein n=1 Tax=Mycena rosella TaxID=1033263 RepID=A0AAD7BT15_MYCRO|nr:hypothetical protein B0H17DRAFT_1150455 [Mycena rosella]
MSSGTSSHTSSPRKPREPCSNTAANCHSDRNDNCVQLFCKRCCVASTAACRTASHNEPSRYVVNSFTVHTSSSTSTAPSTATSSTLSVLSASLPATLSTPTSLSLAKPYARPGDPSYAVKLQAGSFKFELSGENQAAAYKKARAQTVEAFWWAKDHDPAEAFSVVALHFPLFHPKDSPLIIQFVAHLPPPSNVFIQLNGVEALSSIGEATTLLPPTAASGGSGGLIPLPESNQGFPLDSHEWQTRTVRYWVSFPASELLRRGQIGRRRKITIEEKQREEPSL